MPEVNRSDGGWAKSAAAWISYVDRGSANRDLLLDRVMLHEFGQVRAEFVCDVGCGEGRFCRKLADLGAQVVGLDPTPALLYAAAARHRAGRYLLADGMRLPFHAASFDAVVSYLTLVDIPDFRAAIGEMARVLRPDGRLLIATLSPWASANGIGWTRGPSGERLHYALDHYLEERAIEVGWSGIQIINYHRPLSAYVSALLGAGLVLESFVEPSFTAEQVGDFPDLQYDNRVPNFLVMRWRKTQTSAP